MNLIGTKVFTVKEWNRVADNPRQRDTHEHAKKAARDHLKEFSPAQQVVHVGRLPNGHLVKLDGHTRALMWSDGRLEAPSEITAMVYSISSMDEAAKLYTHFDNQSAVEGARDRLKGAFREAGIFPSGPLLLHGGVMSAFNLMFSRSSREDIYWRIKEWKPELLVIDTIEATTFAVPAPVLCACMLTIRKHGQRATEFWKLYGAGGGTRIDGESCGVDELTRIVSDARARKQLGANRPQSTKQCGRAISCCEAWIAGRNFTTGAKVTDMANYIKDISTRGYIAGVRGAADLTPQEAA